MKKITSLTLMALTLCLQHESHAMYSGLRNYATQFGNRIGQQCTRLYNQGAQRFAPTYQRLTTGARQQLSNFRPQAPQWYSAARNWGQNLNLPTARTAALGLGLGGAGLGAAYLQRPDLLGVVKAQEEEMPSEAPLGVVNEISTFNNIKSQLENLKNELSQADTLNKVNELRWKLFSFIHEHENNLDPLNRQNYTTLVNEWLNKRYNGNLYQELYKESPQFATATNEEVREFLSDAIKFDISLANGIFNNKFKMQLYQKIEIPDVYRKFFRDISKDNALKSKFITAIDDIRNKAFKNIEKESMPLDEQQNAKNNVNSLLNEISKEIQGSSSWWSYFGY